MSLKNPVEHKKITVENVQAGKTDFSKFYSLIEDKEKAPVGISLISRKPVLLNVKARMQHTIISGATGQGKTTLLKTLLSHSFKHNHPVIIIDPKGEKTDILEMQRKARFYGRSKDFCLFSLSSPEASFSYNPLLNGTSEQIKARLMDGLRFEQEYYKAQAALFLGGILSVYQFLNQPVSFSLLDKCLNDEAIIPALSDEVSKEDTDKNSKQRETVEELNKVLGQNETPRSKLRGIRLASPVTDNINYNRNC